MFRKLQLGIASGQVRIEPRVDLVVARVDSVQLAARARLVLEPERIQVGQLAIDEFEKLPTLINDFIEKLTEFGPNPYKGF